MNHPDFRVRGKVFATLGYPEATLAMVKLTNAQQDMLCRAEPEGFAPVPGGWGAKGATHIILKHANKESVRDAVQMAWANVAHKKGDTRKK
jgi:hypothetical protein